MFKNLFTPPPRTEVIDVDLDPRPTPGVLAPSANDLNGWLDGNVEVIDLGDVKRDEIIQPTTWHTKA